MDTRSTISIGLLAGILLFAWKGGAMVSRMEAEVTMIRAEIQRLSDRFDETTMDRFRRSDMDVWTTQLRELNPEINVPEVRTP